MIRLSTTTPSTEEVAFLPACPAIVYAESAHIDLGSRVGRTPYKPSALAHGGRLGILKGTLEDEVVRRLKQAGQPL